MDLVSLQNEIRSQSLPQLVEGWNNADFFKLLEMYSNKCTLEVMCVHFGKTRGQISGLLHRARQKGLVKAAHGRLIALPVKKAPPPKPTMPACVAAKIVKRIVADRPKKRRVRLRLIDDAQQVTFVELQQHHCRWPIGDPRLSDFRFCGCQRVEGKPYCEGHVAKAGRLYDQQQAQK